MVKEISLVRIKLLTKWINDIAEEIVNNKSLTDEDLTILLMSIKDLISDIDKEILIILRENSQNKK